MLRRSADLIGGGGEPRPGDVERHAAELGLVRRDEARGLLRVGQIDQLKNILKKILRKDFEIVLCD